MKDTLDLDDWQWPAQGGDMDLITTSGAARILGLSEAAVRLLEARGELRAERTASGIRLFDPIHVAEVARQRAQRQAQAGR
jgi:DNA-binding transcriptional MerR regulator